VSHVVLAAGVRGSDEHGYSAELDGGCGGGEGWAGAASGGAVAGWVWRRDGDGDAGVSAW